MKESIKYDWFEFGAFGLVRADEIPKYRDELKKYGAKCTAVYFDKTKEEIANLLNQYCNEEEH